MLTRLYSKSKQAPSTWNWETTTFPLPGLETFTRLFLNNQDVASIVTIGHDGELTPFFHPILTDKFSPHGTLEEQKAFVIGNAVDNLSNLLVTKAPVQHILGYTFVVKREKLPPIFSKNPSINESFLVDTQWAGEENVCGVLIPSAFALPFQSIIPIGNIEDDHVKCIFDSFDLIPRLWLELMKTARRNPSVMTEIHDDVLKENQASTYFEPNFTSDWMNPHLPHVPASIVRDKVICQDGYMKLAEIFGTPLPSSQEERRNNTSSPSSDLEQMFRTYLVRPKDKEKAAAAKLGKVRNQLMFLTAKVNFSSSGSIDWSTIAPPDFSDNYEAVMSHPGEEQRKTRCQSLIQSCFQTNKLDWDSGSSGISTLSGLRYFPLAAAGQLLKGNFDFSAAQELCKETVSLDILSFAYQDGSNPKTELWIEKEQYAKAEDSMSIPDHQRGERTPLIPKTGVLSKWRHVVGLLANVIKVIEALTKPSVPGVRHFPINMSCFRVIFRRINQSDFEL
ncbi:hypothetical protein HJC23_000357 [Cyclotella cryptica]|uniref:Uncharacterized protein n=1 Tax=Cyclotella cryptica TaxID=29204 RepID=A0ABD3PPV5_9STRA